MTRLPRSALVPYLAAVVAALVCLNWWVRTAPIDVSPIVPAPSEVDTASVPEPTPVANRLPSLTALSETLSRPLFRSNRRPPSAKPPAGSTPADTSQAAPASSADSLRLVGMMRSGALARRALIRVAGTPTAAWVEKGGEINGWVVGTIEEDKVLIERNGDKAELMLFAPKSVERPQQIIKAQ